MLALTSLLATLPLSSSSAFHQPGQVVEYELDPSWPLAPLSADIEGLTATGFDPTAREVYILQRGLKAAPMQVFSESGALLRSWGGVGPDRMFQREHGVWIQPRGDGNASSVWVTDCNGNTVSRFTPDGRLEVTLGTGSAGHDLAPLQFGCVADVSSDPRTGDIFIGDGDGGVNDRVMRLADTTYDLKWVAGINGTGTNLGEFASPHSVAFHARTQQLIVADRENDRIQILNAETGMSLGIWKGRGVCEPKTPWSVRIDEAQQLLLVVDGPYQPGPITQGRLLVFDLSAPSYAPFASPPSFPDCRIISGIDIGGLGEDTSEPHEIALDGATGDVYVAFVSASPAKALRYRQKTH